MEEMNEIKEKRIKGSPKYISLKRTEIIVEQMKKKICKIILENGNGTGTGFFCKIPFQDKGKELSVLITNEHIINEFEKEITIIYNNNDIKTINLKNRKKYINKNYDITIIEIEENDYIKDYLEIDKNIMIKDYIKKYNNESIYLLHYPENEKLVSYGIIKGIMEDKYNFIHLCSTEAGSSGSPILNYENEVIGIHKSTRDNYSQNLGSFLNFAIEEYINKYNIINELNEGNNVGLKDLKKKDNNKNNIIKELNKRYNLGIKDDDNLEKIDLRNKNINNKDIEYIEKLNIENLKELRLDNNQITNIKILDKEKFKNLEILGLNGINF